MSLAGKVCLVTGASRGIGKGIALQLGEAGAKVYITGRSLEASTARVAGGLRETAKEIEDRGGKCIPIRCDHSKDSDVEQVFKQIEQENSGQLDILVNNAYSAVKAIADNMGVKFWNQPLSMWDEVNVVGLRNHYICSVFAAKLMVPRKSGLIVNVSSGGGLKYLFNIPYGVGKQAVDRMAADCGHELRKQNVAFVSLWPGAVKTEFVDTMFGDASPEQKALYGSQKKIKFIFEQEAETIEFPGKCVVHLYKDPNLMKKSGKIHMTGDLGHEYGFTDINGRHPKSSRQLNYILGFAGYRIAPYLPDFLKVPGWMVWLAGSKF